MEHWINQCENSFKIYSIITLHYVTYHIQLRHCRPTTFLTLLFHSSHCQRWYLSCIYISWRVILKMLICFVKLGLRMWFRSSQGWREKHRLLKFSFKSEKPICVVYFNAMKKGTLMLRLSFRNRNSHLKGDVANIYTSQLVGVTLTLASLCCSTGWQADTTDHTSSVLESRQ